MNFSIEGAMAKHYDDGSHVRLRAHLSGFVNAHNSVSGLIILRGLTSYETIYMALSAVPS